jgi:hypothetical protein
MKYSCIGGFVLNSLPSAPSRHGGLRSAISNIFNGAGDSGSIRRGGRNDQAEESTEFRFKIPLRRRGVFERSSNTG